MILTRQKHIPWLWVVLITSTSGVAALVEQTSGSAMTFTLKKFTSDPALISFLASINIAFNFLVAPYTSWKSDRIWTRWGRRKPFMIAGLCILLPALIAAPLAPNIWILTAVIILYQFALDFGYTGPWGPMLYEIVPLHQRGRMVVIKRIMGIACRMLYNLVLIGQFDAIYNMRLGGKQFAITGEMVLYGSVAVMVCLTIIHLAVNVRELKPDEPPRRERFSPRTFFKDVFTGNQFVMIYLLMFCLVALQTSLGPLGALLTTEQFGYTKATLGKLGAFNLLFDICLIVPVAMFLADRFDRFRTFQVGLFLSTLHPLAYWIFVKYAAANGIPSPTQIIVFALFNSFVDSIASLAMEPYFFDLVPRSKMGAINSGFLFVRGLLSVVVANGVGLWVKWYSWMFATEGKIDYMSGYLFVFMVGMLGCAGCVYFGIQRSRGRVIEYGKLEEATLDGSSPKGFAVVEATAAVVGSEAPGGGGK